jgi:hypothetical protein
VVYLLKDIPPSTTIDLGHWDGIALAAAMRSSKAAELPWWMMASVDRFVGLIFAATKLRKDEPVMRTMPGFLAQLAFSHTGHLSAFPLQVERSAVNMWGHILGVFNAECPTLSKHSMSIFRTLLPHALRVLVWAKQQLMRCVLQVVAFGLQCDHASPNTVISTNTGMVVAIGNCLSVPDFQIQQLGVHILLCMAPYLPADMLTSALPSVFRTHWSRLPTLPSLNNAGVVRGVLMSCNMDNTDRESAVLSLKVRNSIITTTGYSTTGYNAEHDLNIVWFDVGSYSITCEHGPPQDDAEGVEILLSDVRALHFAESTESGVLHMELQFSCSFLAKVLYGEYTEAINRDLVHKFVAFLVVDSTDHGIALQVMQFLKHNSYSCP